VVYAASRTKCVIYENKRENVPSMTHDSMTHDSMTHVYKDFEDHGNKRHRWLGGELKPDCIMMHLTYILTEYQR